MDEARIGAVREFSRFYTRRIGLLQETLLESPFSLAEGRVVWELAHRGTGTATELCGDLGMDAGYLSRIVRRLDRRGVVERRQSTEDRRRVMLSLTVAGRAEFERIDRASREEIAGLLAELTESQQERVVSALNTARRLLSGGGDGPSWILRPPQAGDMGWVVQSHGSLYAREYGWDWTFESLVAEIVARFVRKYDPARERCWIAEREDERVGCVFLVRKTDEVGQLRCLLVDPSARGLGIGRRLVRECVRHARDVGYRRMMLWTAEVLDGARRIYEAEGFGLVASEPSRSFGHDVVFQSWERAL